MKNLRTFQFIFLLIYVCVPQLAFSSAQHVPIPERPSISPQIEWDATGIGTAKVLSPGVPSQNTIDFTDSAIQLGGSQGLFDDAIGSFTFGTLITDQSVVGTSNPLFVHQALVTYQAKSFEVYFGRTDDPMAQLIELPTIRADDLITFTSHLNPYSNGTVVEEHRYANVGSITFNQNLSTFENFHVQHLIHSRPNVDEKGIEGFGVSIEHLGALPGLEALSRVVHWGLGYERVQLATPYLNAQNVVYGGGEINLNNSVTDRIEFRIQDILTFGNSLAGFQSLTDTFAADSNSLACALVYMRTPFGMPGYQISLIGGYKTYSGISDSNSSALALTYAKRLGMGFDGVAQYSWQSRGAALSHQYSDVANQHIAEVGLIFNFESTFNRHLNPRRSLLNNQHQYIPQ